MTNSTIGWCDKCEKEVSLDHDCTSRHNLYKVIDSLKETKDD